MGHSPSLLARLHLRAPACCRASQAAPADRWASPRRLWDKWLSGRGQPQLQGYCRDCSKARWKPGRARQLPDDMALLPGFSQCPDWKMSQLLSKGPVKLLFSSRAFFLAITHCRKHTATDHEIPLPEASIAQNTPCSLLQSPRRSPETQATPAFLCGEGRKRRAAQEGESLSCSTQAGWSRAPFSGAGQLQVQTSPWH